MGMAVNLGASVGSFAASGQLSRLPGPRPTMWFTALDFGRRLSSAFRQEREGSDPDWGSSVEVGCRVALLCPFPSQPALPQGVLPQGVGRMPGGVWPGTSEPPQSVGTWEFGCFFFF